MAQRGNPRQLLLDLERRVAELDHMLLSFCSPDETPKGRLAKEQEKLKAKTRDELVSVRSVILQAKSRIAAAYEGNASPTRKR